MKLPARFAGKGFTLVEVLIAAAIFVIVIAAGLFMGLDFYRSSVFTSERDTVVAILRKVRTQAAHNVLELPHGVFIDKNHYVIFAGPSYAQRNQQFDEMIAKSAAVSASGTLEIVFRQLLAMPVASGTIILSDGVRNAVIEVNEAGRINW